MVVPWTKAEVWGVVQLQVCFESRASVTDRGKMGAGGQQTRKIVPWIGLGVLHLRWSFH